MQPPRVTATRIVYENRWMRLHEDTTERADGTPGLYAWIEKPPAAVIVPVDAGFVWLVEQHRHPIGSRFWELPQGAWEDDPSAAAEDLARGELAEETGLRAATWRKLGVLHPCYGLTMHAMHVFLASDLTMGTARREATEADMITAPFPVAAFERMIRDGTIKDALTIAAYGLFKLGA